MKKDGLSTLFNIYYYYYFVLAIINLIFIYFNISIIYNITTSIMIISILIEYMIGFVRGCFGTLGYILSIAITYLLTDNLWLSISIGLSVIHIIYIFINRIFFTFIRWIDRKFFIKK